jgi:hypothetical protein
MARLSTISLVLLTASSLFAACSSDGNSNNGSPGGAGIDCPGVDGVYYYSVIGTGSCASRGVSVEDRGLPVQNHGAMMSSGAGCTSKVTYAGCTVTNELDCALGIKMVVTETFAPGAPNMVTGTQTQTDTAGNPCVFEIYGSTDLGLVLEHAGLGDAGIGAGGLSALATPSTPAPSNLTAATAECEANAQAEEKACPRDASVTLEGAYCAKDWARYDAEGCGDAFRALTTCRTAQIGSMDCATGEIPGCSIYKNAYTQCTSAFVARTGCVVAGIASTLCAGGLGTYSYGCLAGRPPAASCSAVLDAGGSSVPYFCCY